MKIEDYFSRDPDQVGEILRLTEALYASGLGSAIPEKFPGGWNEPQLDQSIWDPEMFGDPCGLAMGWGKIEVGEVVHPAMYDLIGRLLGISSQEVRNIAWWQSTIQNGELKPLSNIDHRMAGARLLKQLLAQVPNVPELEDLGYSPVDLILPLVGIPPLEFRMPVACHGSVHRPSYLDVLLNDLAFKATANDLDFGEDDYGWLMERSASLNLQVILERMVHSVESVRECDRWETEQSWVNQLPVGQDGSWQPEDQEQDFPEVITPEMVPEEWEKEDFVDRHAVRNVPLRLLQKKEGILWMQFAERLLTIDLSLGETIRETKTLGELLGMTRHGNLAYRLHGQLCLLNPESGEWILDHSGEGFVYREDTESERATLVNFSTYQSLRLLEVLDYPICGVRDASGKFIWVEDKEQQGGIYELESGHLVVAPGAFSFKEEPLFLKRDGELIGLSEGAMEIMEETLATASEAFLGMEIAGDMEQAAFCIRNNRWWFFAFNSLWIQGQEVWRIDKAITAAAFSADGRNLFLANDKELRMLVLEENGNPNQSAILPLDLFTAP